MVGWAGVKRKTSGLDVHVEGPWESVMVGNVREADAEHVDGGLGGAKSQEGGSEQQGVEGELV